MIQDAIVDEIRAIRDEIAKEHNYDIHAIFEAFRAEEARSGTPHVSFVRPAEQGAEGEPNQK